MLSNLLKYFNHYYPDEQYTDFKSYWIDHACEFPRCADIETTPLCDAKCLSCKQHEMKKEKGIMSLDTFKQIADILKTNNCRIRGMYTTGNPLIDPTLFEKFQYARQIKAMMPYVSLNCTTSLLTPNLHKPILDNTDNITLSFFATGKEFERLTGGLSYVDCFKKAIDFIKYRDSYRPDYRIFIGCNAIAGANLKAVKKVFADYNVEYAVDAELRWGGKVVTGVIDRTIMYPQFRCDGHFGALKIKWNGNIEACAYDFNEETLYSNIFTDPWETIRQKFFKRWIEPFHLCQRCDYYHKYWMVKKNHFKDVTFDEWQKPFIGENEEYQK